MIQIPRPVIDAGPFVFGPAVRTGLPVSFRAFVGRVNPRYQWYPHVVRLAAVLQRVADGELARLMVFAPPRHGKSEIVSRLFAAYYLYRHPRRWVGINSYAAELAYTLSRNARNYYTRAGQALSDEAAAVRHWETEQGGGLWAAGVGGPITGKGYHLGIIDDPVKNAEDAASETLREKQWDWYRSTLVTREEPGAALVVIQTRWHEDDLSGRLLANESEEPEGWHIVHMEALKDDAPPEYPATCTVEPDDRRPGEALAPARYPAAQLERIRRRDGDYFFSALYQQRPRPRSGNLFKTEQVEIVTETPPATRVVRYWDKAGTKDAGAHTAGVLMAVSAGVFYVLDLQMGQWEPSTRERVISQTAATDRAQFGHVVTYVEQEPGSGGKESAENTIRNNPGYTVMADRPTGDKVLRAEPFAAQVNIGNVKLLRGDWNRRYLDVLGAFPRGAIKDPVDASSGAFSKLAHGSASLPKQDNQASRWQRF